MRPKLKSYIGKKCHIIYVEPYRIPVFLTGNITDIQEKYGSQIGVFLTVSTGNDSIEIDLNSKQLFFDRSKAILAFGKALEDYAKEVKAELKLVNARISNYKKYKKEHKHELHRKDEFHGDEVRHSGPVQSGEEPIRLGPDEGW